MIQKVTKEFFVERIKNIYESDMLIPENLKIVKVNPSMHEESLRLIWLIDWF